MLAKVDKMKIDKNETFIFLSLYRSSTLLALSHLVDLIHMTIIRFG